MGSAISTESLGSNVVIKVECVRSWGNRGVACQRIVGCRLECASV